MKFGSLDHLSISLTNIRVHDRDQLRIWYSKAFLMLQQMACRFVAKVWVKEIHPKKVRFDHQDPSKEELPTESAIDTSLQRPNGRSADLHSRSDKTALLA